MADITNADKAAEIIEKSTDEPIEEGEASQTIEGASEEDKPIESEDKPAGEQEGKEVLYAGIFKTPDAFEKSVTELAGTLNRSTLDKRILRQAIADAKQSNDFTELETIYKEMQADQNRLNSKVTEQPTPEQVKEQERTAKEEQDSLQPLEPDERRGYLVNQITNRLKSDGVLAAKFRDRGVDMPKSEVFSPEWDEEMVALADQNAALYALLKSKAESIARYEADWLKSYEGVQEEARSSRASAEANGKKVLDQFNSELSMGLTSQEVDEIVKKAIANPKSYENKMGLKVLRENAVAEYFNNNVLPGKVKDLRAQAKTEGALDQSKALQKMKEEAQATAGKSNLSSQAGRRGKDAPDFSTRKGAESATPEQRSRRVEEILQQSQDKD